MPRIYCLLAGVLAACFLSGLAKAQAAREVPKEMHFADMTLELSEEVRDRIRHYAQELTANDRYLRRKVERADAYFPLIEEALKAEGAPTDLKYLVLQESSLVSDAVSSSDAVGFWQFKKATALEVGLRVDKWVDQRMNIVASSRGAARYIVKNNQQLENWVFALLSYYAGLYGTKSVVDHDLFGAKEMELGANTHWYVIKFLAHKLVFQDAVGRNPFPPLTVQPYPECEGKTLEQIATETEVPLEDLEFYNKWLKKDRVPEDRDYTVLLPRMNDQHGLMVYMEDEEQNDVQPWEDKGFNLRELFIRKTENYTSDKPIYLSWNGIKAIEAKQGDNISTLAMQGGIPKEDFLEYNDLRSFDLIVPGQIYYIHPKRRRAKVPYHFVREGETLWEISQQYGIKLEHLLKKNRMEEIQKLKPGRKLYLRRKRPKDQPIEYREVEATPAGELSKRDSVRQALQDRARQKGSLYHAPRSEQDSITQKTPGPDTAKAAELARPDTTRPDSSLPDSIRKKPENQQDSSQTPKSLKLYQKNRLVKVKAPPLNPVAKMAAAARARQHMQAAKTQEQQDSAQEEASTKTADSAKKTVEQNPREIRFRSQKSTKKAPKTKPSTAKNQDSSQEKTQVFLRHAVESGQTLYRIAKQYKTSVDSIIYWNNMTTTVLQPGQELLIKARDYIALQKDRQKAAKAPENSTASATTHSPTTQHEVKSGDTLYSIARKYGVSVEQLLNWNNKSTTHLSLGERLTIHH